MQKKAIFLLFAALSIGLFAAPAQADLYLKSKMLNDLNTNETWVGENKQRMVTGAAGFGGVMGDNISIIRADKGVQWELNTQLKVYEEQPLAQEYSKEFEKQSFAGKPRRMSAGAQETCSKVKKLPHARNFSGIQAHGFMSDCGKGDKMVLWIADEGQAPADSAFQAMQKFQTTLSQAYYAKYSKDFQKKMIEVMPLYGSALAGEFAMPDPALLPKSLAVGMEIQGQSGAHLILEILEIKTVAEDPSLYEIPEGYKKVTNLTQLQTQQMADYFLKSKNSAKR